MAEGDHSLIDLKILSPSTEVKSDINLPQIPASTTVKELRQRIQNEIDGRPATERMRLIYRGRVVANETDTLSDVFGLENIRNSREQSLHLVLRELHPSSTSPSPAPRSSTVPPNPFRPVQTLPQAGTLQTNPFRAIPQPRPSSQPQVPHPHHHHHHHHHPHPHPHPHPQQPHNPFGPIPLPPGMNDLVQQQVAQAMAQNNPQAPAQNQQSGGTAPAPTDGNRAPQAPAQPMMGPTASNLPPNTTSTIRHEAIGPNGERWTITRTNANLTIPIHPNQQPILPRPFPHPPGFPLPARPSPGPPGDADQILSRARAGMQTARQEMDNVRALLLEPGGDNPSWTPPVWRINRIGQHIQGLAVGLDQVQRGVASLAAYPSLANSRDVIALQQSANELRGDAEGLNAMLDRLRRGAPTDRGSSPQGTNTGQIPSSTPGTDSRPTASQVNPPSAARPSAPELFILSSPQGPVGILFDQRGTYSTAPMVPTLPFQTFSQRFDLNRQILAGVGQQLAQNSNRFHNQLAAAGPAQNEQPAGGAQAPADQPAQNQNANQAQAQNPAENDRLGIWAGHAWLVFKLVCFVYIFAGHGSWYRPIMMGVVACLVYLAQIGIFENQFNRIRRHFEALLHLADHPGHDQNQQGQNAAQGQGEQRAEPNRNLTPEQAAQRLVQQHQEQRLGWIRQSMRTTERAFAIFVASLWPGIGERMVQAQEERQRAERAAEEERQRREEEERQQEAAQKQEAAGEQKEEVNAEALSTEASPGKGKEKAEVAEEASS